MSKQNIKKVGLFFAFGILFFWSGLSFAEDNLIHKIEAKFCNQGSGAKQITLNTDSGKSNDLCVQFKNISDQTITFHAGFVDTDITHDGLKLKACKDQGKDGNFARYISGDLDFQTLTLKEGEVFTSNSFIKFPAGFSGIVHGCLVYYTPSKEVNSGIGLGVLVRKTHFIDILVDAHFVRDIFLLEKNTAILSASLNKEDHLILALNAINKGDVSETFLGTGEISNIFGFKKSFVIGPVLVKEGETKNILQDLGILPFYKGFFSVTLEGAFSPQIAFASNQIAPLLKQTKMVQTGQHFFFFSRFLVFGICLITLLFWGIIRNLRKK